jgi:lysophospholipase L1-like esterase
MHPKLKSKVWWISVGGEDLARGGCSEEATELGILRVAEEVQWHRPNDAVVIQGMLPRSSYADGRLFDTAARTSSVLPSFLRRNSKGGGGDSGDDRASLWPSMIRINDQLAKFCEGHPRMVYFDASNLFLGTVGNEYYKSQRQEIVKELMPDHVHPSVQGMQVLAQRMEKELMRIINQEDEANDIEQKEEEDRSSTP